MALEVKLYVVRWLLSKGKHEEAKHVMKRMCKWNKRDESAVDAFVDNFELYEKKSARSLRLRDLIKLPATRRNTVLMSLTWLSFSLGYFGLQYNTPAFDWNKFIVFMFPAFLTIPMNYVLPTLENTLGRKAVMTGSMLFGGAMLFLTLVLPAGLPIVVVAWTGTVSCAAAFRSGYTFAKELYPTTLRASGLGTASAAARIGSMISPLVAILGTVDPVLPMLVFGASMLASGVGSVWIWPETKSLRLMYTAEECEAEAATKNEWVEAIKCRRRRNNKPEGQIKK